MAEPTFPMLDGPPLPWPLARIVHEVFNLTSGLPGRPLSGVASAGGYRWADVPKAWEALRRKDRPKYRDLFERAAEFARATAELDKPGDFIVPASALPPAPLPPEGLGDLAVVCWKWRSASYRVKYESRHVNTLAKMVRRHYAGPQLRFVCITDDPRGIDPDIEIMPLWRDHSGVPNPSGTLLPSCYRRLKLFSAEMGEQLKARRVVSLDLDVVISGDLTPLWDRPDNFVGWRVPSSARTRYAFNGSMWMVVPGAYPQVWGSFDPVKSPALAKGAQYFGSDQGWMSYCLRDLDLPGWTAQDGVYSFPRELRTAKRLPDDARIVIFHGARKPWDRAFFSNSWVQEYYR